jgi:7-carboxy-7-deazaguanine synthase
MRVAEIYRSRQGEGVWTGCDSVFVRTSGCNLRCVYCDTPYASWSPEGDDLAVDAIVDRVLELAANDVVLTGGEPMLFSEMLPLTHQLREAEKRITIETAGTLYLPVACDLMSISPKMSNSTPSVEQAGVWHNRHERVRFADNVVSRLVREYRYQFKFVIGCEQDVDEVTEFLARIPEIENEHVYLMPQGVSVAELAEIGSWLPGLCEQHDWKYCPRKHIEWFGLQRGT